MKVLVTTLGKGQKTTDGHNAVHGKYRESAYQFEGCVPEAPTQFFGLALYRHLLATGWRPDRIVVLGTMTSMWDAWLESDIELEEQNLEFEDELYNLQKPGLPGVDGERLLRLSALLSDYYHIAIDCHLIPMGQSEEEQLGILSVLNDVIVDGDEFVLDVTHGFRHLPMLEMVSALLLRHVREAEVKGIYYGALDMTRNGVTPVVRLDALPNLARWIEAVAVLEKTGSVLPLAECPELPENLRADLRRYQFAREMNEIDQTVKKAKSIAKAFLQINEHNPVVELFRPRLMEMFDWASGNASHSEMQLHLAEEAFRTGEPFRAVILLFETVVTRQMEIDGCSEPEFSSYEKREAAKKRCPRRKEYHQLREFRNALAHGTDAGNPRHAGRFDDLSRNETTFGIWFQDILEWVQGFVLGPRRRA